MPDPGSQDCCGRATVYNFMPPRRSCHSRCLPAPTRWSN